MKKLKFALVIFVSLFLTVGTNLSVAVAAGPPDQQCDAYNLGGGYTTMIRDTEYLASQTFTPTQNRLSRITITVLGDGNGEVGMALLKDGGIIAFNTDGMIAEPNGTEVMTMQYNDIELVPGHTGYKILPIYSVGNASLFWYKKTACYDGGAAYFGSTSQDFDFDFATYGFDYVAPVDPPAEEEEEVGDDAVVAEDTSSDTTATGTEADPSSKTTTSSIRVAKNLSIVDTPEDQGGSVDLIWEKSITTGVEGYQIYRKDSEEGDFEAVVAVDKDQLTYADSSIETGKIYFYSVRAYKGDNESYDSNEVQAEAVDNLAPEAPKNFKLKSSTTEKITLSWDANGEEDLKGYYLTVIKHGESSVLKMVEISKDETGYVLNKSDLEGDLDEVSLYLQAEDANGNFSDRSGPVTSGFVNSASTIMSIVFIVMGVLVLAGIIYFLIRRRKKKLNQ